MIELSNMVASYLDMLDKM